MRKQIRDVDIDFVGRDSSVGITTCYELDGPGIQSRRSQWPRPLRQGSDADRLLGLLVHVPPGSWMFFIVRVVHYGQKAKARTITTTRYG